MTIITTYNPRFEHFCLPHWQTYNMPMLYR